MGIPKPITFTAAGDGYSGPAPENFVIVGDVPGAGGGVAVTWGTLAGKPATFPPTVGTTASTALAGNTALVAVATTAPAALAAAAAVGTGTTAARADHAHAFPTAAQVGAAAVSHTQAATTVTVAAVAGLTGANAQLAFADLQAQLTALVGRVAALETP